MRRSLPESLRVLAIDPTPQGLGFVVLEGQESLIDWGLKNRRSTVTDMNAYCLRQVESLIAQFKPDVLVLEDSECKGSRRKARVKDLLRQILTLASQRKLRAYKASRMQARRAFAKYGAYTKHQIAVEVSKHFPELAPRVPQPRKPWQTEACRMSIFDATALALTFFHVK